MKKKHTSIKSKLFKLKEWLTISETAKHLSNILGEDVTESDILRLALEEHLKLSVYFVNEAHVRYADIVEYGDVNWPLIDISLNEDNENSIGIDPIDEGILDGNEDFDDKISAENVLFIGERGFLNLHEDVRSIEGVWDLPMIGNERLYVENKYQQLTDGPEVQLPNEGRTFVPVIGTFIEDFYGDRICQLQTKSEMREDENSEGAKIISWSFVPAKTLPQDSVIVVRTGALVELLEKLIPAELRKNKPLNPRSERTYLNIIGAMLETFIHKDHGNINFPSEAKLREFFSHKYAGFRGLTERTLAEKFSAAKKAIREELD